MAPSPQAGVRTPPPPSPPENDSDYRYESPSPRPLPSNSDWATPSHRSNTSSTVSVSLKDALSDIYRQLYSHHEPRCLLTLAKGGLQMCHVIQKATKSPTLSLYEYCLGLDYFTFHVNSRRNLFYLNAGWHQEFDKGNYVLLPSADVLQDFLDFISIVISARKAENSKFPSVFSKWPLHTLKKYTIIPLPFSPQDPFSQPNLSTNPPTTSNTYNYPYDTAPDLECHIIPPFAIINASAKCAAFPRDQIMTPYLHSPKFSTDLRQRLDLVFDIWEMMESAKQDAAAWETAKSRKRKRDIYDDVSDRMTQSSRRSTGSQSRALHRDVRSSQKRKAVSTSSGSLLTEHAVYRLDKRQKALDFRSTIKCWAESVSGMRKIK